MVALTASSCFSSPSPTTAATAMLLLWLTPIRSPSRLRPFLRCTNIDIDTRWSDEAEALSDFREIETVDVEDGSQAVAGVGLDIRSECFFCALGEIVILSDQLFELGLHVEDLAGGEFEFDDWDASVF